MSRLTWDGTTEPVSQDPILRRERGQGNVHFLCSADQDGNLTRLSHTQLCVMTIISPRCIGISTNPLAYCGGFRRGMLRFPRIFLHRERQCAAWCPWERQAQAQRPVATWMLSAAVDGLMQPTEGPQVYREWRDIENHGSLCGVETATGAIGARAERKILQACQRSWEFQKIPRQVRVIFLASIHQPPGLNQDQAQDRGQAHVPLLPDPLARNSISSCSAGCFLTASGSPRGHWTPALRSYRHQTTPYRCVKTSLYDRVRLSLITTTYWEATNIYVFRPFPVSSVMYDFDTSDVLTAR